MSCQGKIEMSCQGKIEMSLTYLLVSGKLFFIMNFIKQTLRRRIRLFTSHNGKAGCLVC
jgi:hypothetical protein